MKFIHQYLKIIQMVIISLVVVFSISCTGVHNLYLEPGFKNTSLAGKKILLDDIRFSTGEVFSEPVLLDEVFQKRNSEINTVYLSGLIKSKLNFKNSDLLKQRSVADHKLDEMISENSEIFLGYDYLIQSFIIEDREKRNSRTRRHPEEHDVIGGIRLLTDYDAITNYNSIRFMMVLHTITDLKSHKVVWRVQLKNQATNTNSVTISSAGISDVYLAENNSANHKNYPDSAPAESILKKIFLKFAKQLF